MFLMCTDILFNTLMREKLVDEGLSLFIVIYLINQGCNPLNVTSREMYVGYLCVREKRPLTF